jgi:hypothetical protein
MRLCKLRSRINNQLSKPNLPCCRFRLLMDQRGLPLVTRISGVQVHDSNLLIPLVVSITAISGFWGARENVLVRCTLIERTLRGHIELGYVGVASRHGLRAIASCHRKGPVDGVEALSAYSGGFIVFADCAFVTSDELTFAKRSFACPRTHLLPVRRKVFCKALLIRMSLRAMTATARNPCSTR